MSIENESSSEAQDMQREQVRSLWRQQRFEDAADLAATLPDAVLIFTPCEDIADHIRGTRPAEALRLYEIAANLRRFEGTQATGSGEGLAAMDHLQRVEEKRENLRRESE